MRILFIVMWTFASVRILVVSRVLFVIVLVSPYYIMVSIAVIVPLPPPQLLPFYFIIITSDSQKTSAENWTLWRGW